MRQIKSSKLCIEMNPLKLKRDSFLINGSYVRYTKRVFYIRSTYSRYLFQHIQKHAYITMKLTIHSPKSVQFAIFFFYNRFSLCNFFFANIFHLTNSRFSRLASRHLETKGKVHPYMKKGRAVREYFFFYIIILLSMNRRDVYLFSFIYKIPFKHTYRE